MSISLREAISLVKKNLKEANSDSRLTNKYIWGKLKSVGIVLVQQDSDKLKLAKLQDLYQPLKCVEMEEAPKIDPCCGIKSFCKIWRTKEKIPDLYSDSMGVIIKAIRTIDSSKEISIITPSRLLRIKKDKNSKYDKSIYGFYSDGHIYLANAEYRMIEIEGLFTEDISHLNVCDSKEKECTRLIDRPWKVPAKLEGVIIQAVVKDILESYKRITEDPTINKIDSK